MRAALLFLAACSGVQYTPLAGTKRPPLPRGTGVDVLVTGAPKCPYDEIGMMRVKASKLEDALDAFREVAKDVGAPQILLKPGHHHDGYFEGIAIAFDCPR